MYSSIHHTSHNSGLQGPARRHLLPRVISQVSNKGLVYYMSSVDCVLFDNYFFLQTNLSMRMIKSYTALCFTICQFFNKAVVYYMASASCGLLSALFLVTDIQQTCMCKAKSHSAL